MKKLINSSLLATLFALTIGFTACKSKLKDADIQTAVMTALKADPNAALTNVSLNDGVATLTGECKDEACKASCEKMASAVKGVKSVVNNLTVAAAPSFTPPVIVADDALTTAVKDAMKAFPGVNATVKDGVISLAGKIGKLDRQKLMMALNALKPKSVDVKGLLNN